MRAGRRRLSRGLQLTGLRPAAARKQPRLWLRRRAAAHAAPAHRVAPCCPLPLQEVAGLLDRMLSQDPAERPTAQQVRAHPNGGLRLDPSSCRACRTAALRRAAAAQCWPRSSPVAPPPAAPMPVVPSQPHRVPAMVTCKAAAPPMPTLVVTSRHAACLPARLPALQVLRELGQLLSSARACASQRRRSDGGPPVAGRLEGMDEQREGMAPQAPTQPGSPKREPAGAPEPGEGPRCSASSRS